MEYNANVIIKAEPLATGLASDVHGQVQNHCFLIYQSASCKFTHQYHSRCIASRVCLIYHYEVRELFLGYY